MTPLRHVFAKLLLVMLSALATVAHAQAPLQKISIAAGGDGMQWAVMHVAIAGGFMAKEGLDAEFLDINSGPRVVASVMGGSAEFGALGFIQVMKVNAQGGSLISVSSLFNILDPQLVLSNDAIRRTGITDQMSLDDKVRRLKGLKLGITSPGSTTDALIRSLLKVRGMDPDGFVSLQPLGGGTNMLAALEKGVTDGFVWGAPQAQIAEAKHIGKVVVDPFKGEVPEIVGVPYDALVTSNATLASKPEIVVAAVRAFALAMHFIRDHPTESRQIMRKHFPDLDEAIFDAAWSNYRKGIPTSPAITREMVSKAEAWMNITASPKILAPYEKTVAPGIATKAQADIASR